MIETPTVWAAPTDNRDRLDFLMDRIAVGDRAAFRSLYAFLAMRVLRDALRVLPHAADARAVTRSTFVEVWHLAGDRVGPSQVDTRGWITTIAARRVEERLRTTDPRCPTLDDYDGHVQRELVALLGAGPHMIRTGRANFTRTDTVDADLVS